MYRLLDGFSGGLGSQVGTKIQEKSIPKVSKNQREVKLNFEGLLDRFWADFGPKLGGKLGPSWHQNLKKSGPKTMSKKRSFQGLAGRFK